MNIIQSTLDILLNSVGYHEVEIVIYSSIPGLNS